MQNFHHVVAKVAWEPERYASFFWVASREKAQELAESKPRFMPHLSYLFGSGPYLFGDPGELVEMSLPESPAYRSLEEVYRTFQRGDHRAMVRIPRIAARHAPLALVSTMEEWRLAAEQAHYFLEAARALESTRWRVGLHKAWVGLGIDPTSITLATRSDARHYLAELLWQRAQLQDQEAWASVPLLRVVKGGLATWAHWEMAAAVAGEVPAALCHGCGAVFFPLQPQQQYCDPGRSTCRVQARRAREKARKVAGPA